MQSVSFRNFFSVFLFLIHISFFGQSQEYTGVFLDYENSYIGDVMSNSSTFDLTQTITTNELPDFKESCQVTSNFEGVYRAGIAIGGFTGFGFWGIDVDAWGYDLDLGLSYQKMNFSRYDQNTNLQSSGIFDYYQMGKTCSINNYGLNFQLDFGTIVYGGIGIDAGVSHLKSIVSSSSVNQKVTSLGWYAMPEFVFGVCIPLSGNLFMDFDPGFKMTMKCYVSQGLMFLYYPNTKWVADNKEIKNFSSIQGDGNVGKIGFSLTLFFRN